MGLVDFSLNDIGGILTSAREAITGEKISDPTELAKIDLALQQLEQASRDGQIQINKIEAAHKSLFIAGWRPFIGWTSGAGVAYAFVIKPFLDWALKIYISFSDNNFTPEQMSALQPVSLDLGTLLALITSLLGMAGLRTYEKRKGVSREK